MKEDKLYHMLFKNRIKKRFVKNRYPDEQLKLIDVNPEHVYSATQNLTLPGMPRFEYLDLAATFYSKSRRRVCD